jgi:hypothetical protein
MHNLKIAEGSENYAAIVVKVNKTYPIVGADKIIRADIFGNDVIINKNSDLEKLYVFFPSGTVLNSRLLYYNNLYRDAGSNSDSTAPVGFFDNKGRVKALKLRGVISTGFLAPLDYFKPLKLDLTFKEGDIFTDIGDTWLVRKYIVQIQKQSSTGVGNPKSKFNKKLEKFDRLVPGQFNFHIKTPNLGYSTHVLKLGELICITDKLHGTSAVFSNVLVNKELKWYEKILKKVGVDIEDKEYGNLYSSRSVLKNSKINPNTQGYYNKDVWSYMNEKVKDKLEQGITIYGEIVGWLPDTDQTIQKGYTYEMPLGSCELYVYRMTYTKPNGQIIELNWTFIKYYCDKHKLKYVPELFYGFTDDLFKFSSSVNLEAIKENEQTVSDVIFNFIKSKWVNEQDDPKNPGKPAEGVVLRFCDNPDSFKVFKLKNKRFMLAESNLQDVGVTDLEEQS